MKVASKTQLHRCLAGVVILLLLSSPSAQAGWISYKIEATASGSLGGVAFTDALVTVSTTVDTDDVISWIDGAFVTPAFIAGSVAGIGEFQFLNDEWHVRADTFPDREGRYLATVNFLTSDGYLILGVLGDGLLYYHLTSAIVASADDVYSSGAIVTYETTMGGLTISSVDPTSGVFTATTAVVPEPAAVAMLAVGVVVVGGAARRRER